MDLKIILRMHIQELLIIFYFSYANYLYASANLLQLKSFLVAELLD